ncbi:MAG TPA: hypothetical protein PLC86_09195 [Candidatus Accumulibacter phosphatis]|nr:hypothetical protein [Candidatus Accumulibacter phosphatis]
MPRIRAICACPLGQLAHFRRSPGDFGSGVGEFADIALDCADAIVRRLLHLSRRSGGDRGPTPDFLGDRGQ